MIFCKVTLMCLFKQKETLSVFILISFIVTASYNVIQSVISQNCVYFCVYRPQVLGLVLPSQVGETTLISRVGRRPLWYLMCWKEVLQRDCYSKSLAVAINILWYNGYGFMLHLHTIDLFQHCYGGLRWQEVLAALILIHPPNNRRRNLVSYFGRYRCLAQIIW